MFVKIGTSQKVKAHNKGGRPLEQQNEMEQTTSKKTYTALERSSLKKDYSKAVIAIGVLVTAFGAYSMDLFLILAGLVLTYVTLYKKRVVFDEVGITTHYNGVFYKKTTSYPYTEFQTMKFEINYGPEVSVGFVRNGMTFLYLFNRDDSEEVMRMAIDANPNMKTVQMGQKKKREF